MGDGDGFEVVMRCGWTTMDVGVFSESRFSMLLRIEGFYFYVGRYLGGVGREGVSTFAIAFYEAWKNGIMNAEWMMLKYHCWIRSTWCLLPWPRR